MKCLYAEQMRNADQAAIELGIPAIVLMENAGRSVFDIIATSWPRNHIDKVIVIAGKGNNGGDGFVTARHLWNAGYDVRVYLLGRTSDLTGHAKTNLDIIINMGLPISIILDEDDVAILRDDLLSRKAGLCIDAIFGTGLSKEVSGVHREVIECINDNLTPVVSVDIPSGLDSNTGFPLGIAVRATITVSFAYPKVGLVLSSGHQYVGDLKVSDISIPKSVEDESWTVELLEEDLLENIPVRAPEAHKGDFGRVAVFAGSPGLTGAACLACSAAMRTGAGLVKLGIPCALNDIMEIKLTEAMTLPMGQASSVYFSSEMMDDSMDLSMNSDSVIIGPGLGQSPETHGFVLNLVKMCPKPVVIDADALNLIAKSPLILDSPAVMTPHPGEMSRLLCVPREDITADRVGAAKHCAEKFNTVTVLKGFRTIIASPSGETAINPTGSSNMASGGMGDVLSGIIGTFMSQGLPPFDAACLGVYLHGLASDRLSDTKGRGQIATDLIEEIPLLLRGKK